MDDRGPHLSKFILENCYNCPCVILFTHAGHPANRVRCQCSKKVRVLCCACTPVANTASYNFGGGDSWGVSSLIEKY